MSIRTQDDLSPRIIHSREFINENINLLIDINILEVIYKY